MQRVKKENHENHSTQQITITAVSIISETLPYAERLSLLDLESPELRRLSADLIT